MRARDVLLAILIILVGMLITAARRGAFADFLMQARDLRDAIEQEVIGQGMQSVFGARNFERMRGQGGWRRVNAPWRSESAEGIEEIVIETKSGDVNVTGHNPFGMISIQGRIWAREGTPEEKAGRAGQMKLQVVRSGRTLLVSDSGISGSAENVSLDISISAPSHLAVQVNAPGGNVFIEDLFAGASAKTNSGNITIYGGAYGRAFSQSGNLEVAGIRGPTEARTESGNLNLYDNAGETAASSTSGEIRISDQHGELRAFTQSGNILVGYYVGEKASLKTTSGEVDVKVGEPFIGEFSAASQSGNLRLSLPVDSDCEIEALSPAGNVVSTLPLQKHTGQHGRLEGVLGKGGGKVSLRSVSGDIRLSPSDREWEQ